MHRRPSLLVLSLASVAATACGGGGGSQRNATPADGAVAATVVVADTAFEPAEVELETGEAVEWSFEDPCPTTWPSTAARPAPS